MAIGPLAMMGIQAGVNGIMGMANNAMQISQQKKLMELQAGHNREATDYNYARLS